MSATLDALAQLGTSRSAAPPRRAAAELSGDPLAGEELQDPLAAESLALEPPGEELQGGGAGPARRKKVPTDFINPNREKKERTPHITSDVTKLPIVAGTTASGGAIANAADAGRHTGVNDLDLANVSSPGMAGAGGILQLVDGIAKKDAGQERAKKALKANDMAGLRLGQEGEKEADRAIAKGSLGLGKAGFESAAMGVTGSGNIKDISGLATAASGAGNALAAAGAVTGIAGSALTAAQSAYEGGKAINVLREVGDKTPVTATGKRWLARIRERQQTKAWLQGLKFAASAVGIVGGALLLASNPVGWAIGLAGAAVGVGFLAGKLIHGAAKTANREKLRTGKGLMQLMGEDIGEGMGSLADKAGRKLSPEYRKKKEDEEARKAKEKNVRWAWDVKDNAPPSGPTPGRTDEGEAVPAPYSRDQQGANAIPRLEGGAAQSQKSVRWAEDVEDSLPREPSSDAAEGGEVIPEPYAPLERNPNAILEEVSPPPPPAEAAETEEGQEPPAQLKGEFKLDSTAIEGADPEKLQADAEAVQMTAEQAERKLSENFNMACEVQEALWADPNPLPFIEEGDSPERKLGYDAGLVIDVLDITHTQAITPSGAELITKKISAIDGL